MSFASLVVHVILLMLVCWLGSELLASDDRLIRRVFGKLSVLFGMYALMCLIIDVSNLVRGYAPLISLPASGIMSCGAVWYAIRYIGGYGRTSQMSMTYEELELNGCYATLCEALRAWHRIQHDHTREIAAKTLKDVYGYEFHLNGGGCSWRLPETDHEWATNGMRALGLPADKFEENALVLARLLDGQTKDYEIASGRTVETMEPVYGSDIERFGVVEQFHNAFRRITTNWDSVLNRKVMDSNLERLLPMAAHAVRIEREGGKPDLQPMLDLCKKRTANNES